jgi:SAM-dependent methyltransferase
MSPRGSAPSSDTRASPPEMVVGADIDVKKLMQDIHEEVKRKREAGLYPPDLLTDLDVVAGIDPSDPEDEFNRAMELFRQAAAFTSRVETGSRLPVVAPLATIYKKALQKGAGWYIGAILGQAQNFAGHTNRMMGMLADRIRTLDDRIEALQEAQNAVSEQTPPADAAVTNRIEALEAESGTVRARERLPLLERSVRALEQRLAEGGSHPQTDVAPASDTGPEIELDLDYVDFENLFRGSEDSIRERQRSYLDLFRDVPGPVVDLGCGRGEFVELLVGAQVPAYGVDRNPGMVARCHEKGLDAREGDLLEHLASLPKASLGGVFCAQAIEHLSVRDVPRLFELAADAIAPGGRLVIETINPESLFVFASAFYVDLGHLRPLHPLTLRFLAEKNAFRDIDVKYSSMPAEDIRTTAIALTGTEPLDTVIRDVNENIRRINKIVFGPQDFAIIATR